MEKKTFPLWWALIFMVVFYIIFGSMQKIENNREDRIAFEGLRADHIINCEKNSPFKENNSDLAVSYMSECIAVFDENPPKMGLYRRSGENIVPFVKAFFSGIGLYLLILLFKYQMRINE